MVAKIAFDQIHFSTSFFAAAGSPARQVGLVAGGITQTEINSSALGTGLTGGSGSALAIDTVSTVTFGQNAVWTFDNDTTAKGLFVTGPIVDPNHVANKAYVDAMSEGLHLKPSVDAATVALLTDDASVDTCAYDNTLSTYGRILAIVLVSGVFTLDGVTIAEGDRVLIKDEDKGTAYSAKVTTVADAAGSLNSTYFLFYTSHNLGYYVWYDVTGFGGVDPTPTRTGKTFTGIKVTVASGATAAAVATATKAAIDTAITLTNSIEKGGKPTLTIGGGGNDEITFVNAQGGACPATADGTATPNQPTLFTFATLAAGTGMTASANGIWVVDDINAFQVVLIRAADFNDVPTGEVSGGAFTFVDAGTVNANAGFVVTTDSNDLTMGGATGEVDNWTQFSGAGAIVAGVGLNKAGNTLNLNIPGLTDMAAPIVAADTIAMYDTSEGPGVAAHREATFTQLLTFVTSNLGDLTEGVKGGVADFTYDGSAAATVALDFSASYLDEMGAAIVAADRLAIWDNGVGIKSTSPDRLAVYAIETYYTTVEVDIPSASFTFGGGVSYYDLATAAIIGATVDYNNTLTRNGVDDMTNVGSGGTANTDVKWKLNNGGGGGVGRVTIGADITALAHTYRVRYKKLT